MTLKLNELMEEWFETTGQEPDPTLYMNLIREEYNEWVEARATDDEHELKELADLIYVINGYAVSKGWDLEEAIYRVHTNNLGRVVQPDGTILRRDDGKIIKNKDAPKINLKDLVND